MPVAWRRQSPAPEFAPLGTCRRPYARPSARLRLAALATRLLRRLTLAKRLQSAPTRRKERESIARLELARPAPAARRLEFAGDVVLLPSGR